ncbi:hypothetical protein Q5752_001977 [Cryptotrichosporon argae]
MPPFGDEPDNRSRNAKAQRRHREKRKAHLKALEESVQVLTAQLDDARRQLAAYATSSARFSPGAKDQVAAENAYLRSENADLRRQLYAIRGTAYPPHLDGEHERDGAAPPKDTRDWDGVKHEPGYAPYAVGQSPPREPPSHAGHGRNLSHSGDFMRDAGESSSAPSSAASNYPTQVDHFGVPIPAQRASTSSSTRSRMFSTSAPSASPYLPPPAFPSDPRHNLPPPHAVDPRYPPAVRYESAVYPQQPPPHSLPRSSNVPPYHSPVEPYGRAESDAPWNPDAGLPPFPPAPVYPMSYQHDSQLQDWRQDH